MDNGNFQFTANGVYPPAPKNYEPLREEMEVGVLPPGVTSTVVNVTSYGPQPRDHIIWSLFSTIYMNFCCLGFMALAFSVKARDRKVVGDMNGASSYGSTAKCLNITALVLTLLSFILLIILLTTGVIAIAHQVQKMEQHQMNEDIFGQMSGK